MTYIKRKMVWARRLWPVLVSLGSASIMLLAFFIPSVQDQWDRYQSRKIVQQYVSLGDDFFTEDKYDMAEQAYEKAFELSNQTRLDIDLLRLKAKVNRMTMEDAWGAPPPDGLAEIDFEMLLHTGDVKGDTQQRITILNSYAQFLADTGKLDKSATVLQQALALDKQNELTYINLGNLADQQGDKPAAEKYYIQALRLQPTNTEAHYNLGLLYEEQGKTTEAQQQFALAGDTTHRR
jgi:tetratricopeptide (TPR) repeat protein